MAIRTSQYAVSWVFLLLLLRATDGIGAKHQCGTPSPKREVLLAAQKSMNAQRTAPAAALAPLTITIRVLWHAIYTNTTDEAYKLATQSNRTGIVSLNAALQQLNSNFNAQSSGANVTYRFVSAGAPVLHLLNEVDYFDFFCSSYAPFFIKFLKSAFRRGNACTLNMFIFDPCPTTAILGQATFPWDLILEPSADGVLLNTAAFNRTRYKTNVWTHEAGHWLGLLHTFQYDIYTFGNDGCKDPDGDFVPDTPKEKEAHFNNTCRNVIDSCTGASAPGFDPWWNHMSYFPCAAQKFTKGQHIRMRDAFQLYRRPKCSATTTTLG